MSAERKIKVDLSGVESFQRVSEGQHVAKIASAEVKQSQGGNDMIVVAFEVTKGADKGSRAYENYPLAETALWKLKGLLQAIGMKADGKVSLDLDKLIGKSVIIEVKHEEYEGKTRAKIDEVKKLAAVAEDEDAEDDEDTEDDEDEDEAPVKKPAKAAKKKPAKKAVEEDDEDDEEDEEEDDDEEEEEKPAKKPVKKPMKKSKPAPEPEEDEDDEDEDDDEEEEEPAPKKKAAKKKAAPVKSKKAPDPDDEDDDDDDWDEE